MVMSIWYDENNKSTEKQRSKFQYPAPDTPSDPTSRHVRRAITTNLAIHNTWAPEMMMGMSIWYDENDESTEKLGSKIQYPASYSPIPPPSPPRGTSGGPSVPTWSFRIPEHKKWWWEWAYDMMKMTNQQKNRGLNFSTLPPIPPPSPPRGFPSYVSSLLLLFLPSVAKLLIPWDVSSLQEVSRSSLLSCTGLLIYCPCMLLWLLGSAVQDDRCVAPRGDW